MAKTDISALRKLSLSIVAATAIVVGASATYAALDPFGAGFSAQAAEEDQDMRRSWFGGRHHARWCGEKGEAKLDRWLERAEDRLDIREDQQVLWVDLRDEMRAGVLALRDPVCTTPAQTAPERMAVMAVVSAKGAEQLDAIQPKLAALYETMDDKQKCRIDKVFGHR